MTEKRIKEQLEEWEHGERVKLADEMRRDVREHFNYMTIIGQDVDFLSKKVNMMAELLEQKIDTLQERTVMTTPMALIKIDQKLVLLSEEILKCQAT